MTGIARYEYRVMPAPRRGEKVRGVKTTPERFGVALTNLMNQMAADGWDYLRADTLPCEERVGLTGRSTSFQTMLVFRRALVAAEDMPSPMPAQGSLVDPTMGSGPRLGAATVPAGPAPALGPAPLPEIGPPAGVKIG